MRSVSNEQSNAAFEHGKLSEKQGKKIEECGKAVKGRCQTTKSRGELMEEYALF